MKDFKIILIAILCIAIGMLIIQNIGSVQAQFLFFKLETPLIVLLLLTAGLGFIIGLLVAMSFRKDEKHGTKPHPPK